MDVADVIDIFPITLQGKSW